MAGELSPETQDHMVTGFLQAMQDRGVYREVVDGLSAVDRQDVEDAVDRHAARQRAAGKPGW